MCARILFPEGLVTRGGHDGDTSRFAHNLRVSLWNTAYSLERDTDFFQRNHDLLLRLEEKITLDIPHEHNHRHRKNTVQSLGGGPCIPVRARGEVHCVRRRHDDTPANTHRQGRKCRSFRERDTNTPNDVTKSQVDMHYGYMVVPCSHLDRKGDPRALARLLICPPVVWVFV